MIEIGEKNSETIFDALMKTSLSVVSKPTSSSISEDSEVTSCSPQNVWSTNSPAFPLSRPGHFPAFSFPLELELSTMGTVDQCLLDRAHVALLKRSRSFSVGREFASRESRKHSHTDACLSSSWHEFHMPNENKHIDDDDLQTTTLCSTEL